MAYATQAATALRLLAAKGATVTLTQVTRGPVDLATNTASETTTTTTTPGVLLPPRQGVGAVRVLDGTLAADRRSQLLLAGRTSADAALSVVPAPGVTATIGGQTFALSQVTALAPDGGTAIVYVCDVEA